MTRRLRSLVLLSALVGATAVVAVRLPELARPPALGSFLPAVTEATTSVTPLRIERPVLLRLEELTAALERPPFVEERRPPSETAAAPEPPPVVARLDARLVGLVEVGGELIALVVEPGETETVHLRVGDLFDGWVVIGIGDDGAQFRREDRIEKLPLDFIERGDGG